MASVRFQYEVNGHSRSEKEGGSPGTETSQGSRAANHMPSSNGDLAVTAAARRQARRGSPEVEWRMSESDMPGSSLSQDPSTSTSESSSAETANVLEDGKGNGHDNRDGSGLQASSNSSGPCRGSTSCDGNCVGQPSPAERSSSSSSRIPATAASKWHHIVWGGLEAVKLQPSNVSRQDSSENDTSSGSASSAQHMTHPQTVGPDDLVPMELYVLRKLQDWNVDPAGILFEELILSEQEDSLPKTEELETESDPEEVQEQVHGELPSIGSAAHRIDKCTPCLLFASSTGCSHGAKCAWCHMSHGKARRTRHCKGKRDRYKRFLQHLQDAIADAEAPAEFDLKSISIPPSIATDPTEMAKLFQRIQAMRQARDQQSEPVEESSSAPVMKQLGKQPEWADERSLAFSRCQVSDATVQQALIPVEDSDFQEGEDQETDSDPALEQAQPQSKQKKLRPCKGKRDRYKKFFQRLDDAINAAEDPEKFDLNSIAIPPSLAADQSEIAKLYGRIQGMKQLARRADETDISSAASAEPTRDSRGERLFQ